MKKVISIIGARPQFIKHAPVQLELQKRFIAKTIHTGQHYDAAMSDIFFKELKMAPPDYHFSLSQTQQGAQTAEMMIEIENVMLSEKPDAVVVYGDTNSTIAGSLVAAKLQIPVIHIEAGLRSFNKEMPEEINRILTDHISSVLLCPSQLAVDNLAKENIKDNVFLCGDVMKDMLLLATSFVNNKMRDKSYYFATIHRPYNTDHKDRMSAILDAFQLMDAPVVFAIHPRTTKRLEHYDIDVKKYDNVIMVPPVGYFDSLSYQQYAKGVITDSGGMQKEAYWLKRKCVTIRKETEWTETVGKGHNTLLFDKMEELPAIFARELLADFDDELYGNGNSAADIALRISQFLN